MVTPIYYCPDQPSAKKEKHWTSSGGEGILVGSICILYTEVG